MKAQNRVVHLVTPAGTMTCFEASTARVSIVVCAFASVCSRESNGTNWDSIRKFQTYSIPSPFHWKVLIKMSRGSPLLLRTGFWPPHKYAHTKTDPCMHIHTKTHKCILILGYDWGGDISTLKATENTERTTSAGTCLSLQIMFCFIIYCLITPPFLFLMLSGSVSYPLTGRIPPAGQIKKLTEV